MLICTLGIIFVPLLILKVIAGYREEQRIKALEEWYNN